MDGGTWLRLSALALIVGAIVGGATIVAIGYFRLDVDGMVALGLSFVAAAASTSYVAAKTARSSKG